MKSSFRLFFRRKEESYKNHKTIYTYQIFYLSRNSERTHTNLHWVCVIMPEILWRYNVSCDILIEIVCIYCIFCAILTEIVRISIASFWKKSYEFTLFLRHSKRHIKNFSCSLHHSNRTHMNLHRFFVIISETVRI